MTAARYALVTGASRGIGAAIAERLARDGFDCALNFRSRADAAEEVARRCRGHGRSAWLCPFDVADREGAASALATLVDAQGPPWAVVLNAGIVRDGLLMGMDGEAWDSVLSVGLGAFYNVLKPVIGPMCKARRGGRVVAIASTSGQSGNAGQCNYAAAKGGLIAATKSLAREVAKRAITANAVAPGPIDSDMTRELPVEKLLQAVPLGRLGRPDEVAAAVSYLCSDDAGYVTGQVLGVNGGLYM